MRCDIPSVCDTVSRRLERLLEEARARAARRLVTEATRGVARRASPDAVSQRIRAELSRLGRNKPPLAAKDNGARPPSPPQAAQNSSDLRDLVAGWSRLSPTVQKIILTIVRTQTEPQ